LRTGNPLDAIISKYIKPRPPWTSLASHHLHKHWLGLLFVSSLFLLWYMLQTPSIVAMKFSSLAYVTSFALSASALPAALDKRAPTIYLAGDSTMAAKGANDGVTDGPSA
jgi:hypothetical protein